MSTPHVYLVANGSGSAGKTTLVLALSEQLAATGTAVCVVDVDPQGNATTTSGADTRRPGISHALDAARANNPDDFPGHPLITCPVRVDAFGESRGKFGGVRQIPVGRVRADVPEPGRQHRHHRVDVTTCADVIDEGVRRERVPVMTRLVLPLCHVSHRAIDAIDRRSDRPLS